MTEIYACLLALRVSYLPSLSQLLNFNPPAVYTPFVACNGFLVAPPCSHVVSFCVSKVENAVSEYSNSIAELEHQQAFLLRDAVQSAEPNKAQVAILELMMVSQ